jgi:toxin YoeB
VKITFDPDGWAEYESWLAEDIKIVLRINALIKESQRHPFTGTGKPEPLKRNLTGWWSRRITSEHRLIYRVRGSDEAQVLEILACRFHY